jgi:hypothetical protein
MLVQVVPLIIGAVTVLTEMLVFACNCVQESSHSFAASLAIVTAFLHVGVVDGTLIRIPGA